MPGVAQALFLGLPRHFFRTGLWMSVLRTLKKRYAHSFIYLFICQIATVHAFQLCSLILIFFFMVLSLAYRHTIFQAFIFFSISNFQSVKLQMFQILHLSNFQIVKRASIKDLRLHAFVWLDLVCLEELAVIYPLLLYGSLWLKIKCFWFGLILSAQAIYRLLLLHWRSWLE